MNPFRFSTTFLISTAVFIAFPHLSAADIPKQPLIAEETDLAFISPFKMSCKGVSYKLPSWSIKDYKFPRKLTDLEFLWTSDLEIHLELPYGNDKKIHGMDIALYTLDPHSLIPSRGADMLYVYGRRLPIYTSFGSFAITAKGKAGVSLESKSYLGVGIDLDSKWFIQSIDIRPNPVFGGSIMAEYYPWQWFGGFVAFNVTHRIKYFETKAAPGSYAAEPMHFTVGFKTAFPLPFLSG